MTSVICSACTQSIGSESDRVYCFGGCDQILHTRCSELSSSAMAAARGNVALKYFCFGCRKQQTCINEINKKCTDLLNRVNVISDLVSKHDTAFENFDKQLCEKVEAMLLPRLLSAIHATKSSASDCNTCVVASNDSYAAVVSALPTVNVPNTANTNKQIAMNNSNCTPVISDLGGGLLRSGKRRNLDPSRKERATMSTESATPCTPRKSATVARIEQTVLLRPKRKQTSEITQKDVHRKLDPAEFLVKSAFFKEDGEAVIRCETSENALKFVNAATKMLSEKYDISVQKPLKPRIKIFGISEDFTAEEILTKIRKQNNLPESSDVKIVKLQKAKSRKSNPVDAVLEVDAKSFDYLIKLERVNIGWNRCRAMEMVNVLRCYNCSAYGHKASSCSNSVCCPRCSGDHNADECEAEYEKCANCERLNKDRKSKNDELLDTNHSAWGTDCPIYQRRYKLAKERIDYS